MPFSWNMTMPECFSNSLKLAVAVVAASLAGCSIHPIPDDVSRYSTEEIVRNVRCEAKEAVRERIEQGLHRIDLSDITPDTVLKNKADFERIRRRDPEVAAKFVAYGASNIAYEFDFMIDENNDNTGSVTFNLPFVDSSGFTLGLDGAAKKARSGHRKFTTVEKFSELVELRCPRDWVPPDRNLAYPLTGSIGVARIMKTFIEVSELGGGKGDFSDTIKFTTELSGSVKPTLELKPVVDRFRVIKADGNFGSGRKDVHQVTVTLSFPDLKKALALRSISPNMALEMSEDTKARALENICIATALSREERFGTLRLMPPEYYCRQQGVAPRL